MPSPLQPEFFALLGIDLFLAISLLTCLLDKHFPWALPYIYQLAALAGFGQLIVSREFIAVFGDYMRFWYSLLYLIVALANIIAVNVYLGIMKKLLNYARVFMFTVTFPALTLTAFFLSNYAEIATHPIVIVPQISWETTFVGIVAFDTLVVGLGTYVFFKPKWWYIALGAGAAITGASIYAFYKPSWGAAAFVTSAIALAIACVLVLGVSVYVLAKIWIETLKERKRRKGGENAK
jgi:3D (Asp-Asp-Asp) domain-containing protein